MRPIRFAASALILLIPCVAAVRGNTPQPPPAAALRLLPENTDVLVQVARPRRLVETLTTLDFLQQMRQLAPVRELFGSTNARRFLQLVAYFERELGAPWPELLDALAGDGAVLGIKFGPNPAPVLLAIQGKDAKRVDKFYHLGLTILEQELARQEAKEKLVKGSYEGIETARIGSEFHVAWCGNALFLSNNEKTLHAGLDRCRDSSKRSMADATSVAEAAKLLPPNPVLSAWINMESARKASAPDYTYKGAPRDDPNLTVLVGHFLDLLTRTPFVCAGVYPEKGGFLTTVQMPRGREGMGLDQLLHVPPPGKPGSRPLLEPKNVLYSESKFLDISRIWTERDRLFNEKQARGLERFDKQVLPFMAGARFSKLIAQTGPYYRFVAAHQAKNGYQNAPKISIPAFALVWELREPEAFGKSMDTILRGVALLAGAQADLKLAEETYQKCKLVGYRFPEDKPLKSDINDLRYNFSPCFTRVGDQFVACSTIELCRELVDLLQKEGKAPERGDVSPARVRLYSAGGAAYLRTIEELLVTQIALDQAVTPGEAREQVKTFLDLIRGLGVFSLGSRFDDKNFRYDLRLRPSK